MKADEFVARSRGPWVGIMMFLVTLASGLLLNSVTLLPTSQTTSPGKNGDRAFTPELVDNDNDDEEVSVTKALVQGASFHSTNGLTFDAEDNLYIASIIGSHITVMDPQSGRIIERFGPEQGVTVPDDLAFGPDGSLYWTGLFTGEVSRLAPDGTQSTVATLVPGANAITFSDDGRLFVAQCFFGDKLYEVDPYGVDEPRLISDKLGPGCALNGMGWGADGFLYGPRWFQGTIVRVDVDSGDFQTVAEDIGVPAAVKFDSEGRLHVFDTQGGKILRIDTETGQKELVATLVPGLDNLAFDSRDRLFISSYADSFIAQVLKDGQTRMVSKGGLTAPGGVAVSSSSDGETVFVADFFSVRGFDGLTGRQQSIERSIIATSALGFPMTASRDGDDLLLSSWPDDLVQVLNPGTGEITESHTDFAVPLNAIRFREDLVVAELGTASVVRANSQNPADWTTLVDGLGLPAGLAATDEEIWVSDWAAGIVLQIADSGEALEKPIPIAEGLSFPEGLAVEPGGKLLVVESGAGRLSRIDLASGEVSTVADGLELGAKAPPNAPPTWIFNGVAVGPSGNIYVTGDISNTLYRINPVGQ